MQWRAQIFRHVLLNLQQVAKIGDRLAICQIDVFDEGPPKLAHHLKCEPIYGIGTNAGNVASCSGRSEKDEIASSEKRSIFVSVYFVSPA